MSFVDTVINEKPGKYETLIESKVLAKELDMKIKQYNSMQTAYDTLIKSETVNRKPPSGGWRRIGGALKQISAAGKDYIWGVNSNDAIFKCKKPCSDNNWISPGGSLKQLTGGESEVWGVNSNSDIYKMNQDGTGSWNNIPGKASSVSQGGGYVWVVGGEGNSVWFCKQPCNGEFTLVSIPEKKIGWTALGNWKDNGNRMLPTYKGIYTKAGCNQQCQGEKYFSLQDGNGHAGQCFCGSDWNRITSLGTCDQDNKITGGGWCNTVYNTTDGSSYIPIHVGPSNTNNKVVTLPHNDMTVNKWQVNAQNPGWGDRFSVKVNGNQLTVTRIDANAGWGEDLYLEGIVQPDPSKIGPPIVQLSCSNQYVYGIDTNKYAWWRPINGTGSWKRFGKQNWQFYWINATSNKYVYAVGMTRNIYKTDMLGTSKWVRADNTASGVATVSGDPDNSENFYITNTNDAIYVHTPESSGGYWDNIPNENYMTGAGVQARSSNDNWKYLGQGKNIDECKVKAVQDKDTAYSSVVYNTTTDQGEWGQTCYGGVKGGATNPQYQDGIITSLAPNGSSRLGGSEGETLLNQMKQLQTEIKSLIDQSKEDNIGLEKVNNSLTTTRKTTNNELSNLLDKLARDRKRINALLLQPDAIGEEEDSDFRQQSNYSIYFLWILLVIISLFLASHIISSPSESISPIAYAFVGIWILIFVKYYYKQAESYGVAFWKYLSTIMVDPL